MFSEQRFDSCKEHFTQAIYVAAFECFVLIQCKDVPIRQ
jgi:hypothetical protein